MSERPLVRCPKCGATNRISVDRLSPGRKAVCGRCGTPLGVSAASLVVTDATFADMVEGSPLPVLLDLWAPWCGPCHAVAPSIEALAAEMAGRVRVGKLNVDENPGIAARYQVRSIPTLLIFHGGREIDRIVGAVPKAEIGARLERALAADRARAG